MSAAAHTADEVPSPMVVRWLGRIEFGAALRVQEEIARDHARRGDTLLLLEHEPVYTSGRGGAAENLPVPGATNIPVVRISRGGDATYHGPGQLVGYVHVDLRRRGSDVHLFLRALEEGVIRVLQRFALRGVRISGKTGVWLADAAGERKIASIGVGVRRGITLHGFALNVAEDLSPFEAIVPCGLSGVRMTSIAAERGSGDAPSLRDVADVAARVLPDALDAICPVVDAPGGMEAP
jgi:lipoyl(octanoyl) transferase